MGQPLSIEHKKWTSLITTRTAGSKLWFVGDKGLEKLILGALARYQEIHEVKLYGFTLMGNHYHLVAHFPKRNRAQFMRDFNSAIARLVGRYIEEHGRRSVWARRYAHQVLPRHKDIEHWFMYVAANPVSSGLVRSIEEYSGYNSFYDASLGIERQYTWIEWSKYLLKRRYNATVRPEDFSKEYTLRYSRLPGYEHLSGEEYHRELKAKLREREAQLVEERRASGKGFLGAKKLRAQALGAKPKSTKTSTRHSFRPLVLSLCAKTKRQFLKGYFATFDAFKQASQEFIGGNLTVDFPTGTYPPPRMVVS